MAENGSPRRLWRLTSRTVSEEGTTVLILDGRLGHAAAAQLESAAVPLVSAGITELVIDLAGVDYLSSAAIEVLERLAAHQEKLGGRLTLRAPSPAVTISLRLGGDMMARTKS